MPYTAQKPRLAESSEELRERIPGWGADVDPVNRPSVPRERFDPSATGAHWELPEQQPERWPRERSLEHGRLTPVFGTSCPPRGLSGGIRRIAYARFSEARAAHWLMLMAADRVDIAESSVRALVSMHPDNPVTEFGLRSEMSHHGASSRFGRRRADTNHQLLDPVVAAGPWLLTAGLATWGMRKVVRAVR